MTVLEKQIAFQTMKNDPKRATGRTLGLALQAIGKAVENPGTEVEFINHNKQNLGQHQQCKDQIEHLAKTLFLDVSVEIKLKKNLGDLGVFVKSNWVSPYKLTPVEKAFIENYGAYPDELKTAADRICWMSFKKGFEAAQND